MQVFNFEIVGLPAVQLHRLRRRVAGGGKAEGAVELVGGVGGITDPGGGDLGQAAIGQNDRGLAVAEHGGDGRELADIVQEMVAGGGDEFLGLAVLQPVQFDPFGGGVAVKAGDAAGDKSAPAKVCGGVEGEDDVAGEEGRDGGCGGEGDLDEGVGGEAVSTAKTWHLHFQPISEFK